MTEGNIFAILIREWETICSTCVDSASNFASPPGLSFATLQLQRLMG
jgi:hypothetical protein